MKIYHFVILFAIFAIGTIMVADMKMSEKRYSEQEKAVLSDSLQRAAEAAAGELAVLKAGTWEIAEQRAIDAFFYSMYASLGILDMSQEINALRKYVPVILIGVKEGYYLYTYTGGAEPDISEDNSLVMPGITGYVKSGLISYEDGLKEHDIVFAAYLKSYDGYCFSSAHVTERSGYIVDGNGTYHLSGCPYAGDILYMFFTKEGCLKWGALPCSYCIEGRHDEKRIDKE